MARTTNTTQTEDNTGTDTASTTTTRKRKFGVNTANIPKAAPTIVEGKYKGNLKNVKVEGADKRNAWRYDHEDKQLFDVVELCSGKKEALVHSGNYTIVGALSYMAEIPNIPGEQDLPMDIMTFPGGRTNLAFAKDEDGAWDLDKSVNEYGIPANKVWSSFQKATGLTQADMDEISEAANGMFDDTEVLEVPERLANVPDAQDMLQACKYFKQYFALVAEKVTGKEVLVNIKRVARADDDLMNLINTGDWDTSCGLLPLDEEA